MEEQQKHYLKAYLDDLESQLESGLDFLNYCTSGTPYFSNSDEALAYIERIKLLL